MPRAATSQGPAAWRTWQSAGVRYVTVLYWIWRPGGREVAASIDRASTAAAIFRQALPVRKACASSETPC